MQITTFTRGELEKIHEASLQVLEKTGIIFHSRKVLEMFRQKGAVVDNDIVFIPCKMVEQSLKTTPSSFTFKARNKDRNMEIGTGDLAIQPNIGPIYVHDLDRGRRKSLFKDFINMQKLAQTSKVVNLVGSLPVEPGDLPLKTRHLKMLHGVLKNTDKPVIGLADHEKQVKETLEMMALAVQSYTDTPFREHHWISAAINPLAPLSFSPDALETLLEYADQNQPIIVSSAIMAGVTGPIHPLGTVIMQNAEILATNVLIQMINPGNPMVYTCASTAAYMKNASFVTGTPELALIHAGGIQMGKEYYNLPTRSLCGMSDAKNIDCQAGFESMQSALTSILAGTDMIAEGMGCLENFMATSYEKFIIDEEIMERAMCIKNGFDTSQASFEKSLDLIMDVGHKNYLTHISTLQNCRNRWTPSVSNWDSHDTWALGETRDIVVKANKHVRQRLAQASESLISKEEDGLLKAYVEARD